ncbi:MAG: hypothetical protein HF314_06110 [Ignavibacteria bacterium]|jgi:hypothetical protein|nr:hypothetical protein [Ignavibacteria bacterium]MCU7502627.1 hypothetical protein [Ignavibacteria bacterium]MCU7515170.1 hypothetical protein [Ignavibacteria bacterium]
MTKRYDIEDENFKGVIKSLKELPRVTAPPDFEMNLRRKLNGLNSARERKKPLFTFNLRNVLIPAGALAATVVLAFLFLGRESAELENPFMSKPSVRTQAHNESMQNEQKQNLLIKPGEISSTDVVMKKPSQKQLQGHSPRLSSPAKDADQMAANDRLIRRLRELNMQDGGSSNGDIDRSLREKPSPYGADQYGNGPNTVNFDGFNIYQGGDRSLEQLRARVDSIRRIMRSRR